MSSGGLSVKKKIVIITMSAIILVIGLLFLSTGGKITSVFLNNFSISEDGNVMTLKVSVASSIGYVRTIKESQDGNKEYITFFSTYGLNSDIGAKDVYQIDLNPDINEIYFDRGEDGFVLTLLKNEVTKEWQAIRSMPSTANPSEAVTENNMTVTPSTIDAQEPELMKDVNVVYMKDSNTGWALLMDGSLLSTNNAWDTYQTIYKFTTYDYSSSKPCISYVDNTLLLVGYLSKEPNINIYQSKDNGKTWSLGCINGSEILGYGGQFYSSFVDNHKGYLLYCGGPACGLMPKILFKTENAGKTFEKVEDISYIAGYPTGMTFNAEGDGFITSTYHGNDNAYLYNSSDGGKTWSASTVQLSEDISYKYMNGYPPYFDGKDGYMILEYVKDTDPPTFILFSSADAGVSWKSCGVINPQSFNMETINSYCFSNKNTVYLIDSYGKMYVIKNDDIQITPQPSPDPCLAYKNVLQNIVEFITTSYAENGTKTIFLDQILNNGFDTFRFVNFTVLDMDGDKTPEVVIQYCLTGDYPYPDFVEVLHYSESTVYGYNFSYRGLYRLKIDGSFNWSNGSNDNGYSKLRFTSDNCENVVIGYCKPNLPTESYFINNQTVTESEYDAFIKSQDDKEDAIWYDFTEENIDKQLSITK